MDAQKPSHTKEIVTVLSVLILITVIVTGVIVMNKKSGSNAALTDSSMNKTVIVTTPINGSYKNGDYVADNGYNSPGGFETLHLKVTINSNKVTDATVSTDPTGAEAEQYQRQFISAYKQYVVGKSVNDIALSRVSGSSLTSNGFNRALDAIKQQAASGG